jgi:hypothetical protein
MLNNQDSLHHNSYMTHYYNIKCSLFIQLKYHNFFSIIPKHTDASLPPWHQFKHSIKTEIRPLNSQPFTKRHFHFPVILELVTCQVLLQWPKLRYSLLRLSSEMVHMPHHLSQAYFHRDRILKLVPRWGKCINVLGEPC